MDTRPVARIDLPAIVSNWKALARSGVETSAVVKADAYGHGAIPVARALADAGCKTFFVAYAEEGKQLREALGGAPTIYVLNGPSGGPHEVASDLRPVINSPEQWRLWSNNAPAHPFALKVDTGMNRLGVRPDQLAELSDAKPALLMSHLACADDPASPMNSRQLQLFIELTKRYSNVPRSLCNSAGVLLGPDYHFDLTRPGIALYGGGTVPMTPGMSLQATILSVFQAQPGESVGYGATGHVDHPMRLATLAIGYADGLPRSLSGKGLVAINGISCPLIGRVSMDLITVDTTHLHKSPRAGDLAEVFGSHISLGQQAHRAGTLDYELVAGLTQRVQRVYDGPA